MKGAESAGEDSRMSRPTPMRFAFKYATKAAPMARAASSLTSPGYVPRTSYALKMPGFRDTAIARPSEPTEVGHHRFIAQNGAVLDKCISSDVTLPAENRLAHDG